MYILFQTLLLSLWTGLINGSDKERIGSFNATHRCGALVATKAFNSLLTKALKESKL